MQLGKFEILEELGRGGFGIVYKARDVVLDRLVAVKELHPGLTIDPTFISRFKHEAQIAANLDHPNLVPVYEFGQAEGRYYIVMGYMPGGSLKELLKKEGPLGKERSFKILQQIGEGLAYAHHKGIIHRDLKPGNILFDNEGKARISDMGFAKLLKSDSSMSMSTSGGLVGTPEYMAPEIWNGQPATTATDIYSIACILIEMLTGKPLFEGDTTPMVMKKHFEPLTLPDLLPSKWKSALEQALEKEPGKRFESVEQLMRELTAEKKPAPRVPDQQAIESTQNKTPLYLGLGMLVLLAIYLIIRSGIFSARPQSTTEPEVVLVQETATKQPNPTQTPTKTITPIPIKTATSTPKPTSAIAPSSTSVLGVGSTKIREQDGMEMVYVEEGNFEMGSTTGDDDEKPVRQVYLDAYWIDKFEVTNGQYEQCVEAEACSKPTSTSSYTRDSYYGDPTYANYPVIYVDWNQAQDYCQWVGGELPTEAQWEKAARGTDGREYPWGRDFDCTRGNFDDETQIDVYVVEGGPDCDGYIDTAPVGTYPAGASPYGALDMTGNVWEWVRDMYATYDQNKTNNPTGPTSGEFRVLRGGSWGSFTRVIRAASRGNGYPTYAGSDFGFRCISPP